MDEQASFTPRSVLGPRRAGRRRLAIVVPALALAAIVWAGMSGARPDEGAPNAPATAAAAAPGIDVAAPSIAVAAPSSAAALGPRNPRFPARVLGLDVRRLDDIEVRGLGRDTPIAVAGWYVATGIDDCPPLAAIYRAAALPELRGDADEWAFCERSGLLYPSRPDLDDRSRDVGLPAVGVTLVIGVVVPRELEIVGADATPVVVVGRFVASGDGCLASAGCTRELVVDHVAWANGL
jgi:hypothetical protein